jgi:DNA-binding LytR/AlgR family response regulator
MRILIIEDEPQAAARIEKLIKEIIPEGEVVEKLDTVKRSVEWLKKNPPPDLILLDVQLADGISFDIFQHCRVNSPVIFTTAYDQYAMRAFKLNSIDYILKPIDKAELAAAVQKFRDLSGSRQGNEEMMNNIHTAFQMLMKKYKTRFVIKVGEHIRTIEVDDVRYFFSQDKTSFCATKENRNFVLDFTMDQLEGLLDPRQFFRINRKYIVRAGCIQDIITHTNSRLKILLKGSDDNEIIVARERVQEFREWLDQ